VSGSIRFEGEELVGLPERALRKHRGNAIAMVFQDPTRSLNPTMRVGAQITEAIGAHVSVSRTQAHDRAIELMELVRLPAAEQRFMQYPHQLSGGMRQRVMIAIALVCEPSVLIADEPTTALDVTIQAQILALLDSLEERLGMATLLITHDMGVVAGRTDRVNVMYAGRVVETAATEALFAGMRHPYTQALLGSIPRLDQDRSKALFTIPGLPPELAPPPSGCRFAARCAHATDQCREHEPPLTGDDPAHLFACWHPVEGPIKRLPTIVPSGAVTPKPGKASANGDAHLLELNNVVREYPVTAGLVLQRKVGSVKAVSGVTLHVDAGETLGLVGESGCGKTTLGKLIVGGERADSGTVELSGKRIFALRGRALRKARRDLQMMFQDPYASLDPRMRVQAILREPLAIQGIGTHAEQDERIQGVLRDVGLPANAVERYPHEFSGGQRQRIGLARALMLDPQVIVADEPVSALDVSIRSQILNLMRRLQVERGTASVVISHDLAVVKYLSDRIGVMYLGKLVELGSGDDIYQHAAHPYTDALIKTIPVPDPSVEKVKSEVAIRGDLPSARNPPSGCRFRTRCPRAQDLCAQAEPPLRLFGPDHFAACHFPLQEALEGEGPVAAGETAVTLASWATVRRNARVYGKGAYGKQGVLALSDATLTFTVAGSVEWEIDRSAITAVRRPWYGMGSYVTLDAGGDHYALAFGRRRGVVALASASELAARTAGPAGVAAGVAGDAVAVVGIRRAARLGREWFELLRGGE
jgi:oligopeptide/dipeptide ABC transporter ATP-binding protein